VRLCGLIDGIETKKEAPMDLRNKYQQQVETFTRVCHHLAQTMYVTGYGGNLAWKLEEDLLLITPTQMNKGRIQPEDLVFIDLAGRVVEGKRRPTGECPMYLKFFCDRPDIVSVIHCHPPVVCGMAISQGKNWLMRPLFPETTTEIGPVPVVPYAEPLTEALAENFAPFLQKYNSFLMENHGLVTLSRGDIEWTLLNVEVLESTAQSVVVALQTGGVKELDRQAVTRLGNVMRARSLPLFGAPGANQTLEGMYFDDRN
jgi:L-fuculose-phosphate aldolase